jgi:ankyrin repeat protein
MTTEELLHAVQWNDETALTEYLRQGGNPNIDLDGSALLFHAVGAGVSPETLRLLIDSGADVNEHWNEDGGTALCEAIRQGYDDLVRVLVEHGGADVNLAESGGNTPLMRAAMYVGPDSDDTMVEYLLAHGADPTKRSIFGKDALGVALMNHPTYDGVLRHLPGGQGREPGNG